MRSSLSVDISQLHVAVVRLVSHLTANKNSKDTSIVCLLSKFDVLFETQQWILRNVACKLSFGPD